MSIWNRLAPKWFRNSKGRLNRIPQPRLEFLEDRTNPSALLQKFLSPQPGAFQIGPVPQNNNPSIVFVDSQLLNQVPQKELSGSQVVVINSSRDAISQIDQALSDLHGIQTLRFISHGQDGAILFGNQVINQNVLNARSTEISAWRSALTPGADILLYGCSVATTSTGRQFVDTLSNLTGAGAAASSNPTGYQGDLTLEYKHGSVKDTLLASMTDWTKSGLQLILPNQNIGSGASFYAGTGQQFPNRSAFADLKTDGSIAAWGLAASGGTGSPTGSSFVQIFSNSAAFAALKSDGSIVGWGSNSASSAPSGTGYTSISSTATAFAALKSDGSISAWGASASGATGAPTGTGYTAIYSNATAFAALKSDGSITVWGNSSNGGAQTNAPTGTGFTKIFSTTSAFAALKSNGTISVWGDSANGGNQASVPTGTGYTAIYSTEGAFAAYKDTNTAISAWGNASFGGTGAPTGTGYNSISSTGSAFAALPATGAVALWGDSANGGFIEGSAPTNISRLYSNRGNFAGVKSDGTIVYWGSLGTTLTTINGNYSQIYSTETAFTAQDSTGALQSFVSTDVNGGSGTPTGTGYTQVYASTTAFSALKTDGTVASWGTNSTTAPSGTNNLVVQSALITKPYFAPNRTTSYTGVATQSFSQNLGGIGLDVTYSLTSGSLPSGLTLNASTGVVSGTPTTGQTSSFTITATNAQGTSAQAYSITINVATTTTLTSSANPSTYGTSVTFTATVTSNPTGINAGTVTFKDGSTVLGTSSVNGSGVATYVTSNVSSPAPLSAGTHSITAVYNGSGFWLTSTSSAVSQVVNQKTLTVTGTTASSKVYDGSTTATLNTGGSTLVGKVGSDDVTLVTSGATGTFSDANIGTAKTVTIAGLTLSGTAASNYSLTQPTTTANITAKALTVTGTTASNKIYDGNTTAAINTSSSTLVGVVGSDDVTLVTSSATGSFATKTVANGKTVTIAGMTITGGGIGNYTLTQPTTTANITAKELTITGTTASNKVYDGNTTATLNSTSSALSGVVSGDTVTLGGTPVGTFASANVANTITVSINGFTISGTDSGNYSLTQPSTNANITAKNLTITGTTASNKVYDQSNTATLNTSSSTLVGVVSGETITLNKGGATGTFPSKNVGTSLLVTISGFTISGTTSGNYTLTQPTTTANITALGLTISGVTASDKVYNASAVAALNTGSAALVGVLSGDTVTLDSSAATGAFPSKNIGTNLTVTTSGFALTGTDAGNYTVAQPTTTATITAKGLTVTGTTANNKVYDGTTSASLNTGASALSGVVSGDTVTLGGTPIGTFASANAANAIAVTISGFTITGTDSGNYTLTQPSTSANITKASQTITWATPSPISLGTALSSTQLNASVSGVSGGSAPGALSYDMPLGTVLPTGSSSVTVTAAATTNYNSATLSRTINVNAYFADPNPSLGNGFGTVIVTLTNGNVVITAPYDNAGASGAGAVYLYSGITGQLLSTLQGSHANDNIGSGGVTALANGNFVILSPLWDSDTATDVGAVTFGTANSGASGIVSSSNSLVGTTANDSVGQYPILALKNGNYVVPNPLWNNGGTVDAGAATFGSGSSGISGLISSTNSLVGSHTSDMVGSTGLSELTNGNYVVRSANWNSASGAVTWSSGNTGVTGVVGALNSIYGSTDNDMVGSSPVTALSNGNFVIPSPHWHNGGVSDAGAATWVSGVSGQTKENLFGEISTTNSLVGTATGDLVGSDGAVGLANGNYVVVSASWSGVKGAVTFGNGNSGVAGAISSTNSLVGDAAGANIGSGGVTALANSNYVVKSINWSSNKGAVTFGNGVSGTTGVTSSGTSLVGTTNNSYVGSSGVTELSNGNYVVGSALWNSGAGAATFASGTSAITGAVSSSNSLVGSQAGDQVGAKVTALKNDNYVVVSSNWANGTNTAAGAVTWGVGTGGVTGLVSSSNSLVGSSKDDQLGSGGITELASHNFVVASPLWSNGTNAAAGAVTWANGGSGTNGVVGAGNSLVGSTANDKVGSVVTALTNGNYVAVSATWDNGTAADSGAVTLLTGSERGTVGAISASNSLVGTQSGDQVGLNGITVLSNSNFVVVSTQWNNGTVGHAGAVTWVSGTPGASSTGTVSSTNSLVGTSANDQIGSGGVTALTGNGNYVVASPLWDGAAANVGAATWGNGADGSTKGAITSTNSLVGSTAEDGVGSGGVTALTSGNYLVKSTTWSNGTLSNAGAVTWGRGSAGATGAVSSTNSTVGVVANATLGAITLNATGGTYLVSFLSSGSGPRVNYGFQDPTAPAFTSADNTTFTSGAAGSFTFAATGSPTPAFSIVSGSLPSGLTLNNTTGVLSGTTTQVGIYNLTIRATNGLGVSTDQAFTLNVTA